MAALIRQTKDASKRYVLTSIRNERSMYKMSILDEMWKSGEGEGYGVPVNTQRT